MQEKSTADTVSNCIRGGEWETGSKDGRLTLKDYLEQCRELVSRSDGGPPRWFSLLECGSRLEDSPVLLSLPGIDGVGLGLLLHHERIGEFFDIWCMHIPLADRTSFTDLVKLVESTVRLQYSRITQIDPYILLVNLLADASRLLLLPVTLISILY